MGDLHGRISPIVFSPQPDSLLALIVGISVEVDQISTLYPHQLSLSLNGSPSTSASESLSLSLSQKLFTDLSPTVDSRQPMTLIVFHNFSDIVRNGDIWIHYPPNDASWAWRRIVPVTSWAVLYSSSMKVIPQGFGKILGWMMDL